MPEPDYMSMDSRSYVARPMRQGKFANIGVAHTDISVLQSLSLANLQRNHCNQHAI